MICLSRVLWLETLGILLPLCLHTMTYCLARETSVGFCVNILYFALFEGKTEFQQQDDNGRYSSRR